MHKLILSLLLLLNLSCSGQPETSTPTTTEAPKTDTTPIPPPPIEPSPLSSLAALKWEADQGQSYASVKAAIKRQRASLQSEAMEVAQQAFTTALLNRIIPHWEGTPWSFEGHTATPQVGEIACGYFVSTTLRDVGMNLNRYHLAQQSPIHEAKSLALQTDVLTIEAGTTSENIQAIDEALEEGLHFIGFDASHVGYVLKQDGALYLIHSNYAGALGVELEPIEQSDVFASYDRFYVVPLTTNVHFVTCWLNETAIEVVRE